MRFLKYALLLISAMTSFAALHAAPALKSGPVAYSKGGEAFEGWLVMPSKSKGALPAVLLIHNWLGITDETKYQAERIAALGYAVFAVDVYGKDQRPKNTDEAGKLAGKYKSDRALLRDRLALGLETLKAQPHIDANRIAVAGYCFGGTAALELARSGADVKAVVSFHGGLDSPTPADGARIKGRVLALHGADDPYEKAEDLAAFEEEMRSHKVDWQLVKYGGAVHSFTEKGAGNDNSKGAAYNAKADARSFEAFKAFLKEAI